MAEGIGGRLRVTGVLVEQCEIVPGMRILGITFDRFFQNTFGLVHTLKVEQGDATIDLRTLLLGVKGRSPFKFLQCLFEELLVHVGHAKIVEARGFD